MEAGIRTHVQLLCGCQSKQEVYISESETREGKGDFLEADQERGCCVCVISQYPVGVQGTHCSAVHSVDNFRPGAMEKFGIGYETMVKANPTVIYANVSGRVPIHLWTLFIDGHTLKHSRIWNFRPLRETSRL